MNDTILLQPTREQNNRQTEKAPYNLIAGIQQHSAVRRIAITLQDGRRIIEAYHDIGRMEFSEDGHTLTLHCSHGGVILCMGDNLHQLMPYLQMETLPHIYCYDPNAHTIGEDVPQPFPVVFQVKEEKS